jgi:D-beta-D-heptose 7-phosphate kinase/D-beta-D-heptose 1-phosphate adenosyltransferase
MMTEKRVQGVLNSMQGQRVVILGDLMLDRYIWGEVSRISPEAPVPVVQASRQSFRLGGSANVVANIQALGGVPCPVGLVGKDTDGTSVSRLLSERAIDTSGLVRVADRPTTVKTRILARNQQMVRFDIEETGDPDPPVRAALIDRITSLLTGAQALIVSDYGKGVITQPVLEAVLPPARREGLCVAVDPKEDHFFSYRDVTVITPNLLEAGTALGRKLTTDEAVEIAGEELRERLAAASVLITRGERGMTLFTGDGHSHFPTVAEEVYDVTGAGDTVVSAFTLAHVGGASLEESTQIANHAASLVIREVGTTSATPEGVLATFRRSDHEEA